MNTLPKEFQHPYEFDPKYKKRVAYFCMEFAIHQALKTYSGGLGFLAGSHMRSAYELKQNVVGIGILWKYGYYDQIRKGDSTMNVLFQEKIYSFLTDTNIRFTVNINGHDVLVKALFLKPETFGTVPMFFLSTDLPENDYLAQATTHNLYDAHPAGKIGQSMLLGIGGAKLLDLLKHDTEVYHLNEAHGLSSAFYLYDKFKSIDEVKKRMVFTTHTPEEAGNEKHDIRLLEKLGFFYGLPVEDVRKLTGTEGDVFSHSLVALRFSNMCNGVSKLHGEVSKKMWAGYKDICPITSITNAQNKKYWSDKVLYEALEDNDNEAIRKRKLELKQNLIEEVANQTGQLFDSKVLTIVWARRFAGYKRPDLITWNRDRFNKLMNNKERPLQIVWAGKPYPMDYNGIETFNSLVHLTKKYSNCAILVGYELLLSKKLKAGADVWLNTPRVTREASGTSGMTAAMNGAINFSTYDGWIPEFARHGVNSFIVPTADLTLPVHEQDQMDLNNMLDVLEQEIIPMYYDEPEKWSEMVKSSMQDVLPYFDANRMAYEYYEKMYNF